MSIERAALLMLRCSLTDAKQPRGHLTEHDTRTYLVWSGLLERALRQLGLKPSKTGLPATSWARAKNGIG
jgi:hypothetical protein